MRASVIAALPAFQSAFEGRTDYLYLDVKALVTTGIGCLVDPVSEATCLDWTRPDGTWASVDEIETAWTAVKSRRDLCRAGGGAFAHLTTLRLPEHEIDALAVKRAVQDEAELRARFTSTGWETLRADAQLACLSICWAVGAYGFVHGFPRCCAAVASGDWATAAAECEIDTAGNLGVIPRNRAVRALFAACLDPGDPDLISGWP